MPLGGFLPENTERERERERDGEEGREGEIAAPVSALAPLLVPCDGRKEEEEQEEVEEEEEEGVRPKGCDFLD